MPGIDDLSVDRGLAANCVEKGPIAPCRGERMMRTRRIEACDRAGGALKSSGKEMPFAGDLGDVVHHNR